MENGRWGMRRAFAKSYGEARWRDRQDAQDDRNLRKHRTSNIHPPPYGFFVCGRGTEKVDYSTGDRGAALRRTGRTPNIEYRSQPTARTFFGHRRGNWKRRKRAAKEAPREGTRPTRKRAKQNIEHRTPNAQHRRSR